MPRKSSVPPPAGAGRTEHVATRLTPDEKAFVERAAHERVRRVPQLLTLSDFLRSLIVEGARRELELADKPPERHERSNTNGAPKRRRIVTRRGT